MNYRRPHEYRILRDRLSWHKYLELLFWERTEKRGEDECWMWQGSTRHRKYGQVGVTLNSGKAASILAHRLSYRLFRGKIPKSMCVCHTCDVPACVNPQHLFLGTIQDNNQDKFRKGRQAKGESHGMAKLSESEMLEVSRLYNEENWTYKKLMRKFSIDHSTVWMIIHNKTWKYITRPVRKERRGEAYQGMNNGMAKLTEKQVKEACQMYATGKWSQRQLAKHFGVHQHTIWSILQGNTWKGSIPSSTKEITKVIAKKNSTKLSESDVREIKEKYATGEYTQRQLADPYRVSAACINSILVGKNWTHI